MFIVFVDKTETTVGNLNISCGYSIGNKVGVVDPSISVDTFFTLYNLLRNSIGNPTSEESQSSPFTKTKDKQRNKKKSSNNDESTMARPNSRSFSSLPS
jgi:hypothetical protein